jgi:hypothetical protein
MDRPVDATAAKERAVRRVDDGIESERGDIGHADVEPDRADLCSAEGSGIPAHLRSVAQARGRRIGACRLQ